MQEPLYLTADELVRADLGEAYLLYGTEDDEGELNGIIPVQGLGMLHGARQTFKTHVALMMAICLSQGSKLFGKYQAAKKCKVAIVQCDMPRQIQQKRLQRAERAYTFKKDILFCFPGPTNIPALKRTSELVERLDDFQPDIIFWDALKRLHHMDPNEDRTASTVYNKLQTLLDYAAHQILHHNRKKSTSKDAIVTKDEEFSGASGWIDMVDFCFHTTKLGPSRVNLTLTKTRSDDEEQPPVPLHLYKPYLLPYTQTPVQQLVRDWKKAHPKAKKKALHRYLLSTFACSPKIAHSTAFEKKARS